MLYSTADNSYDNKKHEQQSEVDYFVWQNANESQ